MECKGETCMYQDVEKHDSKIFVGKNGGKDIFCSDLMVPLSTDRFKFYFAIARTEYGRGTFCKVHCAICLEHVCTTIKGTPFTLDEMNNYIDTFEEVSALVHYIRHWESLGTYDKVESYVEVVNLSREDVDSGLVNNWEPDNKKRKITE